MKAGDFVRAVRPVDNLFPQGIGQIIGKGSHYFTVRWQEECLEGEMWDAHGLEGEQVAVKDRDYWVRLDGDSERYWNCPEKDLELISFENV